MLADCVEHGVARRLSGFARKKVDEEAFEEMAADLHTKTFYAIDLCRWAVDSWAIGLGVIQKPGAKKSTGGREYVSAKPQTQQPIRPSGASAKVSFDYLQSDLDAYVFYLESRSKEPDRQRRLLHLISAAFGILVAIVVPSLWWSRALAFAATWLVLFSFVTGLLWLCQRVVARFSGKTLAKNTVLGRYTIKVSADGIFEQASAGSEHRTWPLMDAIHVETEHLFISGPTNFYVIPLRAFKNEMKKGLEFIALSKEFFDASRKGGLPQTTINKPRQGGRSGYKPAPIKKSKK